MNIDLKDLRTKAEAAKKCAEETRELVEIRASTPLALCYAAVGPVTLLALIDRIEDLEAGVYSAVSDITWAADRHEVPTNILDCLPYLQRLLKSTKLDAENEQGRGET